jgi:hypothetical protein
VFHEQPANPICRDGLLPKVLVEVADIASGDLRNRQLSEHFLGDHVTTQRRSP